MMRKRINWKIYCALTRRSKDCFRLKLRILFLILGINEIPLGDECGILNNK